MSSLDYGIISYFYSVIAIVLVILTFGMETGFFKFAKTDDYKKVLSTSLSSVGLVCFGFLIFGFLFISPIQNLLDIKVSKALILVNILCLSVDAFSSIIFAKLRYENKLRKYLYLRLLNVLVGLGFTVFYLDFALKLHYSSFAFLVDWFFVPNQVVYYAFLANLLGSLAVLFFVKSDLIFINGLIDKALLKRMLVFSVPMLGVGITGMINMNIDKILLPRLLKGDNVLRDLGIYSANFKIGLLMAMFAQSFRMAFEPFCFKYSDNQDIKIIYANVLKYFTIFGMFIFLFVLFYLDIINLMFPNADYLLGNSIIPIILIGQLFSGMFYSQSLWYKISDKPIYGLYLGVFGAILTLGINIIFVPLFGFIAAAWAGTICFGGMVLVSYFLGQIFYPIPYNIKLIIFYIILGLGLFFLSNLFLSKPFWFRIGLNTFLISFFLLIVYWKEGVHQFILRYVNRSSIS